MTIYYRWNDLEKSDTLDCFRSSTQYLISSVQAHKIRSHPGTTNCKTNILVPSISYEEIYIYHLQRYKIPNTILRNICL